LPEERLLNTENNSIFQLLGLEKNYEGNSTITFLHFSPDLLAHRWVGICFWAQ
jgi:hypothetical protein